MITLMPETELVSELREKSKAPPKEKKVSKLTFLSNLYQGLPGKDGDETPEAPMKDLSALAEKLKEAEDKGYFRIRKDTKKERDDSKYLSETKWYLTQAAKKGIIDREYNPRSKSELPQES